MQNWYLVMKTFDEKIKDVLMEFHEIYAVESTKLLAEIHFNIATNRARGQKDGIQYELIMYLYHLVVQNLANSLTDPNEYIRTLANLITNDRAKISSH